MEIFVVVWGGGYEAPSYVVKATLDEAWKQAEEWKQYFSAKEYDYVDVLRISIPNLTIERMDDGTSQHVSA